jgi:hypothetical protein
MFRPTPCELAHVATRGNEVRSLVLHWVVQREARNGALITFTSFVDHPNAERHMAELLEIVAPDDQTVVVTIETLAIPQSPK